MTDFESHLALGILFLLLAGTCERTWVRNLNYGCALLYFGMSMFEAVTH